MCLSGFGTREMLASENATERDFLLPICFSLNVGRICQGNHLDLKSFLCRMVLGYNFNLIDIVLFTYLFILSLSLSPRDQIQDLCSELHLQSFLLETKSC